MSRNPNNGVEAVVRDGRGFNMTLDAHSFELVYQKTSLSTDDFHNHPEKITDVYYAEMVEVFTSSITFDEDNSEVNGFNTSVTRYTRSV